MDKNLQKNSKAIQIHVFKNSFLTFLINFMFLIFFWFFCQKNKNKNKTKQNKNKSDFLAKEPLKGFFLTFFGQNSDNLDRFLVKFHSKLNIFIYHTFLIFKLWQQQFSPKVTKLRPYHLNERTIRPWIQRRPWITSSAEPETEMLPSLHYMDTPLTKNTETQKFGIWHGFLARYGPRMQWHPRVPMHQRHW